MMWEKKRVVVTGGSGFLGSFVLELLRTKGANNVFVPRSRDFDLRLKENCSRVVEGADIVFNLAANVGGIGYNSSKPGELFYDNILIGTNMLHESMVANVEKFIAVATVCGYPKFAPIPFRESDIWNGFPEETNAPYGLAKKMMIVMSDAYRKQYRFNSIVMVPVNLYGPRDTFDLERAHVIPMLIRKIHEAKENKSEKLVVWGDGSPTREFLYVQDAAAGLVQAAEEYDSSGPVNLGSGEEISISDLVKMLTSLMKFEGDIIWDDSKPNGQPRRKLDITRARSSFHFEPRMNLREGLEHTIAWFHAHYSEMTLASNRPAKTF